MHTVLVEAGLLGRVRAHLGAEVIGLVCEEGGVTEAQLVSVSVSATGSAWPRDEQWITGLQESRASAEKLSPIAGTSITLKPTGAKTKH